MVYVDNIIVTECDEDKVKLLKEILGKGFEKKDSGQLKYFLGIEVARGNGGNVIVISQRKYSVDLLKEKNIAWL